MNNHWNIDHQGYQGCGKDKHSLNHIMELWIILLNIVGQLGQVNKLLANKNLKNMLKNKKNTKISVGIKLGKGLLTPFLLHSLTRMFGAVSPITPSNVSQH